MSSMSTPPASQSLHAQTGSIGGFPGLNGISGGAGPSGGDGNGGGEAGTGGVSSALGMVTKGKGIGDRARGFMGNRFVGARGPPPSGPPPLPPPEPAYPQAGPSRPTVLPRTSSRLSMNPFPGPAYPPPSFSLPQPPLSSSPYAAHPPAPIQIPPPPASSGSTSRAIYPRADDRYERHRRQSSDLSNQSYTTTSSSQSVPPSPTAGPPISPRSSSLSTAVGSNATRSRAPGLEPAASIAESRAESSSAPSRRIPSRQLLQTALDLAQQAVEMDQANDVAGALEAYREAVTRLKSVMERVGLEGREGRRGRGGKAEEEGRTLRGIHDAYVARIELLSSYENAEEAPSNTSLNAFPVPPSSPPRAQVSNTDRIEHLQLASPLPSLDALTPQSIPSQAIETAARDNQFDEETFGTTVPPTLAECTPRPSMDAGTRSDHGHGIGEFMLADQSFEPFTPDQSDKDQTPRPESPPSPTRSRVSVEQPPQLPVARSSREIALDQQADPEPEAVISLNDDDPPPSFINPPLRRESLNSAQAIGLGHPGSPPRLEEAARPTSLMSDEPSTPSSRRIRRHRAAVGLEDEAGLTRADGLVDIDDMEEMNEGQDQSPSGGGTGLQPSRSRTGSMDKTLPPLPDTSSAKGSGHIRQSSFGRLGQLISDTTSKGAISQRRLSRNSLSPNVPALQENGDSPPAFPTSKSMAFPSRLPASARAAGVPPNSTSSLRSRSKSQPGQRPDVFQAESADDVPPLPDLRKKASFPSRSAHSHARMASDTLAPPRAPSYRSVSPSSVAPDSASVLSISGSLISPVPESQPQNAPHRPFHVLRTLHASMDPDGPGAYLTGAIHIPSAIWSSTSAYSTRSAATPAPRITGQDAKVRIMDSLMLHLEIIRHTGAPLLDGPKEVEYGIPGVAPPRIGIQAIARIGQELLNALDALEEEMDTVHKSLTKAGVAVGGWKGKKASTNNRSWGSKVVRSMDKMTSSKAIDSADKYVDLLAGLCMNVQVLDDHLSNFTGPCTPAYHAVAEPGFRALEQRFLRSSEFVRVVLVPFLLDDFKQFLFRYLKAGMRYIED